ncbi:alpha/beta hydrolase [Spirosoma rhododendri]|uniref:Esterase family protein n=1 Tax=Spirosoma rhododendri TaxID=2728024 RepID=A0A7L5DJU0_9BACT|nr:alpha/beta hydrolase-fold protein [Spirosoma rhododendri]QJD77712.1 esterase family protein [Spirosoma rhododendri]
MSVRLLLIVSFLLTSLLPASAQSRRRAQLTNPSTANTPVPVVAAPQARLLEGMLLRSSILNQAVRYSIYLPPDYYTSNRHYPVVYLLHGYGDNETSWVQFGEADRTVDDGVRAGQLPPAILVMPNGGTSFFINDYHNQVRYEDMFVQELIPHIDSTFRTRTQREFRAISGLSMGGFGSLVLAMHHPDLFGACAALSAAAVTDETLTAMPGELYNRMLAPILSGPVSGADRLTLTWKRNSPIILAQSAPVNDLKKVRWYIDCGDDDALSEGNANLHIALTKRQIPHEYRVRDGAHNWTYWRGSLPGVLQFFATEFHR